MLLPSTQRPQLAHHHHHHSRSSAAHLAATQPLLTHKLADWRHRIQSLLAAERTGAMLTAPQPSVSHSSPTGSSSSSSSSSRRQRSPGTVLQPHHTSRCGTLAPAASVGALAAAAGCAASAPAAATQVATSSVPSRRFPHLPPTAAAGAGAGAAVSAQGSDVVCVGQVVQVTCERLGTGGVGVCLLGPSQLVLLVNGALPGEVLSAVITAIKKNYAEGTKLSSLQPHRGAVTPACVHYGTCGGCSLQALAYPAQLAHKADYVGQVFRRVGKLDAAAVAAAEQPPVAAEAVYGYRNKVQMAFSSMVWQPGATTPMQQQQLQKEQQSSVGQRVVPVPAQQQGEVHQGWGLGFYLPGSSSVVVDVQQCSLVSSEMNQVVTRVRELCQQHGLQPHNSTDGTGVLRHLIVRSAAGTTAATPTATAAVTDTPLGAQAEAAAAAAAAAADGGGVQVSSSPPPPQLMVVLVTSPAVDTQPKALQALTAVAQQLMASCPGLVSVVHSIEDQPPAAVTSKSNSRSGSRKQHTKHSTQHRSRSRGVPGSETGAADNTSSSSNGSSKGAQALHVRSSRVLAGVGSLCESLCGLQFQLSPHSFFQTNTAQAQRLYHRVVQAAAEVVVERAPAAADGASRTAAAGAAARLPHAQPGFHAGPAAAMSPAQLPAVGNSTAGAAGTASSPQSGVILDLYCGTGTIALCLAAALPQHMVVGFDVSPSSIADAQANAARNNISNVSFVCGDLNQLLTAKNTPRKAGGSSTSRVKAPRKQQQQQQVHGDQALGQPSPELSSMRPRVVVVDPARAGLGPGVVQYLRLCGAARVVYVSCNAATQARDLQLLCADGVFELTSWACVDLFPQTDVAHVETIVVLDRVDSTH